MKKFLENFKGRIIKENKIIILFLILFILFAVINTVINRINIKNNEQITESLNILTEDSKELISKIPDDEEIKVYLFDYTEEDYIFTFAKKYEELNKNIVVEIKSSSENEELVNHYGIKEDKYNILITSGDKSKLYENDDLFSYDYNTGNIINLIEERLTKGIIETSSIGERTVLYVLNKHQKYNINEDLSKLKRYIELDSYEIKELDLSDDEMPEDCKTIIICTLKNDFSDEETDILKDYINNGGNLIWLEDAIFEEKEFNNANSILEMYGIERQNSGVIFEQEKNNNIMQNPYLILPEIASSEINLPSKVMLYYSTKLNFVDDEKLKELNIIKEELLSTSENALFKTDLSEDAMVKKENDEERRFVVGAMLTKSIEEEKNSKLIIFANNYFVTNQTVTIGKEEIPVVDLYNNKELIKASVDYLYGNTDNAKYAKIIPRDYYIGIEDESVKHALIVESIILVVLASAAIIIKKRNK